MFFLFCDIHHNKDRDPTVASRNPKDEVSMNMTIENLQLNKGKMDF